MSRYGNVKDSYLTTTYQGSTETSALGSFRSQNRSQIPGFFEPSYNHTSMILDLETDASNALLNRAFSDYEEARKKEVSWSPALSVGFSVSIPTANGGWQAIEFPSNALFGTARSPERSKFGGSLARVRANGR